MKWNKDKMSTGLKSGDLNSSPEGPVIRVYTSFTSFNKEVKRKQAGVLQVLDAKKISYVNLDISTDEAAKIKLRELMTSLGVDNTATIEIPQIFNRDTHCGNYDDFFWAVEDGTVDKFLSPAQPSSFDITSTKSNEVMEHPINQAEQNVNFSSVDGTFPNQKEQMEGNDLPSEIRVYTSSTSFSKEVKRKQAGVLQVLDAKKISYVNLDISTDEAAKVKLRELMTSLGVDNSATIEIPQIFNRDTHCGNYDDFFWAVEDGAVQKFLNPSKAQQANTNESAVVPTSSITAGIGTELSSSYQIKYSEKSGAGVETVKTTTGFVSKMRLTGAEVAVDDGEAIPGYTEGTSEGRAAEAASIIASNSATKIKTRIANLKEVLTSEGPKYESIRVTREAEIKAEIFGEKPDAVSSAQSVSSDYSQTVLDGSKNTRFTARSYTNKNNSVSEMKALESLNPCSDSSFTELRQDSVTTSQMQSTSQHERKAKNIQSTQIKESMTTLSSSVQHKAVQSSTISQNSSSLTYSTTSTLGLAPAVRSMQDANSNITNQNFTAVTNRNITFTNSDICNRPPITGDLLASNASGASEFRQTKPSSKDNTNILLPHRSKFQEITDLSDISTSSVSDGRLERSSATESKTILTYETAKRTAAIEETAKVRTLGSHTEAGTMESNQSFAKMAKLQEVSNVTSKSTKFDDQSTNLKAYETATAASYTKGKLASSETSESINKCESSVRYGTGTDSDDRGLDSSNTTSTTSPFHSSSSTLINSSPDVKRIQKLDTVTKRDQEITRSQWDELKSLAAETGFDDDDLMQLVGEYVDRDSVAAIATAAGAEKKTARDFSRNVEEGQKAMQEKVIITADDIKKYADVEPDIDWGSLMSLDSPEILQDLLNDIVAIDSEDDAATKLRLSYSDGENDRLVECRKGVSSASASNESTKTSSLVPLIMPKSTSPIELVSSSFSSTFTKTTQIKTVPGVGAASTWRPASPDKISPVPFGNRKTLSGIKTVPSVSTDVPKLVASIAGVDEIATRSRSPVSTFSEGKPKSTEKIFSFQATKMHDNSANLAAFESPTLKFAGTSHIPQVSTPAMYTKHFSKVESSPIMTAPSVISPLSESTMTQNLSRTAISTNTRMVSTAGKLPPFPTVGISQLDSSTPTSFTPVSTMYTGLSNIGEISDPMTAKLSESDNTHATKQGSDLAKNTVSFQTSALATDTKFDKISTGSKGEPSTAGRITVGRSHTMFVKSKVSTDGLAAAIASAGTLSALPLLAADSGKTKALATGTTSRLPGLAGFVSSKLKSPAAAPSSSKGIASAVVGVARAAVAPAAVVASTAADSVSKSSRVTTSESASRVGATTLKAKEELTVGSMLAQTSVRPSISMRVPLKVESNSLSSGPPGDLLKTEAARSESRGVNLLQTAANKPNLSSSLLATMPPIRKDTNAENFVVPITTDYSISGRTTTMQYGNSFEEKLSTRSSVLPLYTSGTIAHSALSSPAYSTVSSSSVVSSASNMTSAGGVSASRVPLASGIHFPSRLQMHGSLHQASLIRDPKTSSDQFSTQFSSHASNEHRLQPGGYEIHPKVSSRISVTLRDSSQAHSVPVTARIGSTAVTSSSQFLSQTSATTNSYDLLYRDYSTRGNKNSVGRP